MNLEPIELSQIAKQINERERTLSILKDQFVKKGREYVAEIILQGQALQLAKDKGKHGSFLLWLANECPAISERTAQVYMRISKAQHTADLTGAESIREALQLAEPVEKQAKAQGEASIRLPNFTAIIEKKPTAQWSEVERDAFNDWYVKQVAPIYEALNGKRRFVMPIGKDGV